MTCHSERSKAQALVETVILIAFVTLVVVVGILKFSTKEWFSSVYDNYYEKSLYKPVEAIDPS